MGILYLFGVAIGPFTRRLEWIYEEGFVMSHTRQELARVHRVVNHRAGTSGRV